MANVIFSISTEDYTKNATVSLRSFARNCGTQLDTLNLTLKDIAKNYKNDQIQKILKKYYFDQNTLRWCLKSALLIHLLVDKKYDSAIYIDNDVYAVNNIDFLILDTLSSGILLTKHNRPLYPSKNNYLNSQFSCIFTDGFFNAGFIGASRTGLEALKWWSSMNYWKCLKSKNDGLFDDQKYLDVMALEFHKNVKICEHPGCNLATWNSQTITRSFENNKWTINDLYIPIFCHFSAIKNYPPNYDPMLYHFYKQYINEVNSL